MVFIAPKLHIFNSWEFSIMNSDVQKLKKDEINNFIHQGCITLIKSESKVMYVSKDFY